VFIRDKMSQQKEELVIRESKKFKFLPGLNLEYFSLYTKDVARVLFDQLEREITYLDGRYTKITVFGKEYAVPRRHAAYADAGISYTYSGLTLPSLPWTPTLSAIKDVVNLVTGYEYNYVLVNRYANGKDCIGYHADDESSIDMEAPIAAVSLGEERAFTLKHNTVKNNVLTLKLESGSLLLMHPPTNQFYKHSLPRRANVTKPRISLTFRKIIHTS
jgi:alpha-ketoglutarate-dependent dioxygenase alkB family protein 2